MVHSPLCATPWQTSAAACRRRGHGAPHSSVASCATVPVTCLSYRRDVPGRPSAGDCRGDGSGAAYVPLGQTGPSPSHGLLRRGGRGAPARVRVAPNPVGQEPRGVATRLGLASPPRSRLAATVGRNGAVRRHRSHRRAGSGGSASRRSAPRSAEAWHTRPVMPDYDGVRRRVETRAGRRHTLKAARSFAPSCRRPSASHQPPRRRSA